MLISKSFNSSNTSVFKLRVSSTQCSYSSKALLIIKANSNAFLSVGRMYKSSCLPSLTGQFLTSDLDFIVILFSSFFISLLFDRYYTTTVPTIIRTFCHVLSCFLSGILPFCHVFVMFCFGTVIVG